MSHGGGKRWGCLGAAVDSVVLRAKVLAPAAMVEVWLLSHTALHCSCSTIVRHGTVAKSDSTQNAGQNTQHSTRCTGAPQLA